MNSNNFQDWLAKTPEPIDEYGNLFYVFLSYKSEDSYLVRMLACWILLGDDLFYGRNQASCWRSADGDRCFVY